MEISNLDVDRDFLGFFFFFFFFFFLKSVNFILVKPVTIPLLDPGNLKECLQ